MIQSLIEHNDEVYTKDIQIYQRDRQKKWIFISIRLIRDAEGKPLSLDGFLIDISAKREGGGKIQSDC